MPEVTKHVAPVSDRRPGLDRRGFIADDATPCRYKLSPRSCLRYCQHLGARGSHVAAKLDLKTTFELSGMGYIIDLRTRSVVGAVTGVGNDPYGLAVALQ